VQTFIQIVNNSGNPVKIDIETAKRFIEEVFKMIEWKGFGKRWGKCEECWLGL